VDYGTNKELGPSLRSLTANSSALDQTAIDKLEEELYKIESPEE
jgi:hypothetical protein